ncbi:MAG: NAD-dependent epimerase/dehydratase family protein, partial [Candidatus Brocadiaceae bacterium]|nr:NAD-dependent epimerase/dehydratase family protein [Candidatus Brocadiaceae bacterium]
PYLIELYEKLAQPVNPCKVLGISLNCVGMSDNDALREIQKVEKETKLPATDPIKFGVDKFIGVIRPLLL